MNIRCSKHVEDKKKWIQILILKSAFCWRLTLPIVPQCRYKNIKKINLASTQRFIGFYELKLNGYMFRLEFLSSTGQYIIKKVKIKKKYHRYLFRSSSFLLVILYLCQVFSLIGIYDFHHSDYQYCTVVVLTCFVMCGCFQNICTCIYCVLYCLYCVFVLFLLCKFIHICLVCTGVRTTANGWKLSCSK